jgi:hypothetical protein
MHISQTIGWQFALYQVFTQFIDNFFLNFFFEFPLT